jgi:hypothetical protein
VCVCMCVWKKRQLYREGPGPDGEFVGAVLCCPPSVEKKKKNKAKPAKRKRKSHSVEIPGTDCPEWWGLYTYEVETPHMSRRRPLKWGHMSSTAMSKG